MGIIKKRTTKGQGSIQGQMEMTFDRAIYAASETGRSHNILKGRHVDPSKTILLEPIHIVSESRLSEDDQQDNVSVDSNIGEDVESESKSKSESESESESESGSESGSESESGSDETLESASSESDTGVDLEKMEKTHQAQLQAALDEQEKIAKDAIKNAYNDGFKKGEIEGKQDYIEKADEITALINQAIDEKNEVIRRSQEGALMLALDIAEEIVKSEVATNEQVLVDIVTEAMTKISDSDRVIVRINEKDIDSLKPHVGILESKFPSVRSVIIQGDTTIEQGGCILETNMGFIDATLRTKLDIIQKIIMLEIEKQ